MGAEKFGAPGIETLLLDVLATIKFNNQSALDAGKKLTLCVGLASTQFASLGWTPHPNPFTLQGRGSRLSHATRLLSIRPQQSLRLSLRVLHRLLRSLGTGQCGLQAVVQRLGDALVVVR